MKHFTLCAALLSLTVAASAQTWTDVTDDCVTNPTYDGNYDGWSLDLTYSSTVGYTSHCFRFFGSEGSIGQTITLPQAGTYRISLNAFYRPGDFSQNAVDAHNLGTETIPAVLFAGDSQVALASMYSDYSTTPLNGNYKTDSEGHYYPDNSAAAWQLLSQGKYPNEVTVEVGDERQLTIGVSTGELTYNSWLVMTNWKVELQDDGGEEQPSGEASWLDLTSDYVQNPSYKSDNYEGWDFEGYANSTDTRAGAQEFWNGFWDFHQTLTLPQAGKYRLSVQGYYRVGENSNTAVQNYENQTEDITCVLYANDDEVPLQSVYSAYSTNYVNGAWGYNPNGGGWGYGPGTRYYPNTMESGVELFKQNKYWNELETEVGDDCLLTIGIRNDNYANSNWTLFTNWKLEWYGTEVKATRITLSKTAATLMQGESLQLNATVAPANTTFRRVTFASSDESVATVDQDGNVSALNAGTATITASMATGSSTATATCRITVEQSNVLPGDLVLNEVQQANVDMFIDPSWNFGGWIELYNTTEATISLNKLYISDDPANLQKMQLDTRFGTVPAKGFRNIWFDHYSRWAPGMVNFKLDTDGGTIILSSQDGTIIFQENYPPAITRTSYARTTDGGNEWNYTDQPTPEATNTTSAFAATRLATPVVDHAGGLFTGHVTAIVNIPAGATLRYTTDGSTPTLTNGMTSQGGRFDIEETTILRVRLFKSGMLASPVVTRSFILRDKDYTLPVISLVSDNKNLYGADYGIFVQGNGHGRPGNGQDASCNWNMDWDRPANIEFFTEEGRPAFNQEAGIEAAGGWSRAWEPHSFNIKANKIYEGQNRMDYQFFPDKPFLRHKALKVRNGGNDTSNRIKDAAIQQVVATSGLYVETQAYLPVHVFHNGRYIGVENLREPNNKNYGLSHYGIDTDDDIMDQWKMSPDSGYVQQVGDREAWEELLSLSENADDALTYEQIKGLIDIEEYCNYLAVEFYIGGTDWPQNNIKAFRERSQGLSNSRFRFILFDTDGAFSATTSAFSKFAGKQWYGFDPLRGREVRAQYGNNIYAEIEFVTLFLNLLQNEDFSKQFADQFCLVAGSVFEHSRVRDVINDMLSHVNPAMQLEGRSASSTANSVISNLSASRQQSLVGAMRDFIGLSTDDEINVSLDTDLQQATLRVNGLCVPTGKFAGKLYIPAAVTADAPAGYRFAGWQDEEGNIVSASATLQLEDDAKLTATFLPQDNDPDDFPVRINEVSAANDIFVNDLFKKNDWIELYNPTDEAIDVAGMYLSDKADNPQKFQIPAATKNVSTLIPAHGHLVIWTDKLQPVSQLHADFKLAQEGGSIILSPKDGSWYDIFSYGEHDGYHTVGLYPDGGTQLYVMERPTIGAANTLTLNAVEWDEPDDVVRIDGIKADAMADFALSLNHRLLAVHAPFDAVRLDVYNVAGQLMLTRRVMKGTDVDLSALPAGAYVAVATSGDHQAKLKFTLQ